MPDSDTPYSHVETDPPTLADLSMLGDGQPASRAVAGLVQGGRVLGMTTGQFSMIDLLRACLAKTGPADLWLSTWTAGIRDIRNAAFLLERGPIQSLRLLVDRSFASRKPKYCAAITRLFGDAAIRCTFTHAKVAIVRNADWAITIRSSMNLNKNPRFENYDIDESREIAAFFERHFTEMQLNMPLGPIVSHGECEAVFDRVARGWDPFKDVDRQWLAVEGVPIEDLESFGVWLVAVMRSRKQLATVASQIAALADGIDVTKGEIRRIISGDPPTQAVAEEIGAWIVTQEDGQ